MDKGTLNEGSVAEEGTRSRAERRERKRDSALRTEERRMVLNKYES